jgi:hypothetical protein
MKGDEQRAISIKAYWDDKERSDNHRKINQDFMQKVGKSWSGIPKTDEWKEKASKLKLENKNPQWKGDNAGISSIHCWLLRNCQKKDYCENCGKKNCLLDNANLSGKYTREISDYKTFCRSCHMKYDYKKGMRIWHKDNLGRFK